MSTPRGKILIIVENLPVPFDTRTWQEATTLASAGYEVSVICPKGAGAMADREILEDVHVYRHHLREASSGFLGYLREYFRALYSEYYLAKQVFHERGFDVIQGCNPPDTIFLVAKKFKRYGVDYVFDHHDICPELFEAKFGSVDELGFLKLRLYRAQLWLERQTYRNCALAFVTNESYRQIAVERDGMDPDKVLVLRSGPNLERVRQQSPNDSLKEGHHHMVGYVGVIGEQEGLEYLLEVASILRGERGENDILWAVAGSGPALESMKKRCKTMGLDGCVRFLGRVDDQTLMSYLNTAEVCINCDSFNTMNDKSTMNKVLEYMALAKPIVQFDLTEGRRSAAEASLYARPNDASDFAHKVGELLDDREKRMAMGELGYRRIRDKLSWEKTSKVLLEGYERYFSTRLTRERRHKPNR